MEIEIKGYIKIKKTPDDILGEHVNIPLDKSKYEPLFGKMTLDSEGDIIIVLGEKEGDSDFVFSICSKDEKKESIVFNYKDSFTGFNTMYFEASRGIKPIRNKSAFSTNDFAPLNLTEYVETISIENDVCQKGGCLKIKARVTAGILLKYMLELEMAVVPAYNA